MAEGMAFSHPYFCSRCLAERPQFSITQYPSHPNFACFHRTSRNSPVTIFPQNLPAQFRAELPSHVFPQKPSRTVRVVRCRRPGPAEWCRGIIGRSRPKV